MTEFAVVGGGLAGLTAALALVRQGKTVRLVAPLLSDEQLDQERRTTALLSASVSFLRELGVWAKVEEKAYPLKIMRIVDGTNRLLRAPQVDFRSSEIDLEAFGYNVENRFLLKVLEQELARLECFERIDGRCTEVISGGNGIASLAIDGGQVEADIFVAADGRNSMVREGAGIKTRKWSYPQQALVFNFTHTLPHNDASTEFHTETGPFTVVPLGKNRSSLVWVVNPDNADAITSTPCDALAKRIEDKMQSFLGKVTMDGKIQGFPLSGMVAKRFGAGNLALVGEAAHVFPPIGAQGFNLGIRDIEEVVNLTKAGTSPEIFGQRYHLARFGDISSRTASVDLLNRSLLNAFLPVQLARSVGLYTLSSVSPLRRFAMRQGVTPDLRGFSPFNFARDLISGKGHQGQKGQSK